MMNSKRTFYQPITMTKKMIKNTSYEGERPLFASHHLRLEDVTIYPGESALKECSDIEAVRCEFRGKYPFWHNDGLLIENCLFREGARAAIWYSRNLRMKDTRVEAPKMFRDMDGMVLENVVLTDALECCWHCRNAELRNVQADKGDYLFMHGENMDIDGFRLNGNYSLQECGDPECGDSFQGRLLEYGGRDGVRFRGGRGIPGLAFQKPPPGELPYFRHAGVVLRGEPGAGKLHVRGGCGPLF